MRILVLTSVYKDISLGNRDKSTNIVNSFANDWVKQGHELVVIHNSHVYPKMVHTIPISIKNKLASRMGFAIADYDAVSKKKYEDNGAIVYRLPIKKFVPHKSPSDREIANQTNKIVMILNKMGFKPDVITGHWASPQMEIIFKLKKIYNCKTAIVLHGTGYINSPKFDTKKYLQNIDHLGARSLSQAKQIQEILNLDEMPFVCYSGVPDSYLERYELNTKKFEDIKKWKFAYVGRLVDYKNIDATIKALSEITSIDWEFNIIGDGAARKGLERMCKELQCESRVKFWGLVARSQVMQILSETHVFIMISTNEIFGLAYLEAMAATCITVASKEGGIDGIIVDGRNGYLCKEGNYLDLKNIIKKLTVFDKEGLIKTASLGYNTSLEYSDSKVAEKYLDIIKSAKNKIKGER